MLVQVTVENFLRVLTGMECVVIVGVALVCSVGRLDSSVPRSKRLLTDDRSNILVYMTG